MTKSEYILDDKYKVISFVLSNVPEYRFEILTDIENDSQEILDWRLSQLQEDFDNFGDYTHSDLFVSKKNDDIENGNNY